MLVPPAVQRIYKLSIIWPSRGQRICTSDLVVLLTCSIIRRNEVKGRPKQCTLPSGSGFPSPERLECARGMSQRTESHSPSAIVFSIDMHLEFNARLSTYLQSSLWTDHLRDIVQVRFHAILIAWECGAHGSREQGAS